MKSAFLRKISVCVLAFAFIAGTVLAAETVNPSNESNKTDTNRQPEEVTNKAAGSGKPPISAVAEKWRPRPSGQARGWEQLSARPRP